MIAPALEAKQLIEPQPSVSLLPLLYGLVLDWCNTYWFPLARWLLVGLIRGGVRFIIVLLIFRLRCLQMRRLGQGERSLQSSMALLESLESESLELDSEPGSNVTLYAEALRLGGIE
ncbi:hypothetical protein B0H17DRAFT_1138883 [Mycena rosella]|uniref:Uncharacterized protein n=1 Tax=Mycena rosella TaxID=1033263 RepID=A0AAD7GBV5_MYCRO|nr:hypothetical protein B0H17DRAFT_1138883 [Mycena rosella]